MFKRLALALGLSAALTVPVVVTNIQPAAAAVSSHCYSGKWYVHAPYPISGKPESWATCVTNATTVPWPDVPVPGNIGIQDVSVMYRISPSYAWVEAGVNYENGRSLNPCCPPVDTFHARSFASCNGAQWVTKINLHYGIGQYDSYIYSPSC